MVGTDGTFTTHRKPTCHCPVNQQAARMNVVSTHNVWGSMIGKIMIVYKVACSHDVSSVWVDRQPVATINKQGRRWGYLHMNVQILVYDIMIAGVSEQ